MNGETKVHTIANCHEKMKQIMQDSRSPRLASKMIPIVSVVKPLS